MATIEICDICGSRDGVKRQWFCDGRESDAAGSMEDVGETFDLCSEHQCQVLEATILYLKDKYKFSKYEVGQISTGVIKRRMEHDHNKKD